MLLEYTLKGTQYGKIQISWVSAEIFVRGGKPK